MCLLHRPQFVEAARLHLQQMRRKHYEKFEQWLQQESTAFTAGSTVTAGDFALWEMRSPGRARNLWRDFLKL